MLSLNTPKAYGLTKKQLSGVTIIKRKVQGNLEIKRFILSLPFIMETPLNRKNVKIYKNFQSIPSQIQEIRDILWQHPQQDSSKHFISGVIKYPKILFPD